SDLLELLDLFAEASRVGFDAERLRRLGLEPNAARSVERVSRQLQRQLAGHRHRVKEDDALSDEREKELLISILAGYPDRVARRRAEGVRRDGSVELLLAGGGTAELAPESVVRGAEFLVAVDA